MESFPRDNILLHGEGTETYMDIVDTTVVFRVCVDCGVVESVKGRQDIFSGTHGRVKLQTMFPDACMQN